MRILKKKTLTKAMTGVYDTFDRVYDRFDRLISERFASEHRVNWEIFELQQRLVVLEEFVAALDPELLEVIKEGIGFREAAARAAEDEADRLAPQ